MTEKGKYHNKAQPKSIGNFVVKEAFDVQFSAKKAFLENIFLLPGGLIALYCSLILLAVVIEKPSVSSLAFFVFICLVTILTLRHPMSLTGILIKIAKGQGTLRIHPNRVEFADGSGFDFDFIQSSRAVLFTNVFTFYKKDRHNFAFALMSPSSFRPFFGQLTITAAFRQSINDLAYHFEEQD